MAEDQQHKHHLFHHKQENTGPVNYEKEEKHAKNKEHLGETGAVADGGFGLYEKHEEKDPENAHKHKIEEEILGTAAVRAEGYALHEKHEKKANRKEEEAEGGKKHHLFG